MVVSNNKVGEVWLPRTRLVKRVMLLPSLTALGSNLANCMFIHKIKEWRSVDWSYEWPGSRKPFKTNLYWGLHKKKGQLYWNKAEIREFWLLKQLGAITLQIFTKMLQSLREQISHVTTYVKKKKTWRTVVSGVQDDAKAMVAEAPPAACKSMWLSPQRSQQLSILFCLWNLT